MAAYACRACGMLYASEREADLCTNVWDIPKRYPTGPEAQQVTHG